MGKNLYIRDAVSDPHGPDTLAKWGNHKVPRSGATPLRLTGRLLFHHTSTYDTTPFFVSLWQSRGEGFVLAHSMPPFQENGCTAIGVSDIIEAAERLENVCRRLGKKFRDRQLPAEPDQRLANIVQAHDQDSQLHAFFNLCGRAMVAWDEWAAAQTQTPPSQASDATRRTTDTGNAHQESQSFQVQRSQNPLKCDGEISDVARATNPAHSNSPMSQPTVGTQASDSQAPCLTGAGTASRPSSSIQVPGAVESDLFGLPGAGPGLVWMLGTCGIKSMQDLGRADATHLRQKLGLVGEVFDVAHWITYASDRASHV